MESRSTALKRPIAGSSLPCTRRTSPVLLVVTCMLSYASRGRVSSRVKLSPAGEACSKLIVSVIARSHGNSTAAGSRHRGLHNASRSLADSRKNRTDLERLNYDVESGWGVLANLALAASKLRGGEA